MTQETFVLVVSDRPEQARGLTGAVAKVIACRSAGAGAPLPVPRPIVVVVDLAAPDAAVWMARLTALRVACLHLSREPSGAASRGAGLVRVMPARAARTAILAVLFDLVDASQKARARRVVREPAIQTLANRACLVVSGVFEAVQTGGAVSSAAVDAGTEVILEAVSDGGIRRWLEAIARYDDGLYQHSLSVAGYAAAFGHSLRLNRADQMRLAKAALLHDVGKARIPRAILNKPGALTPEETAVMRTHPMIGADLLARQDGFDPSMLAVLRHHHEMLDGTGYPDGLAGAAIPDLVRLVTICDIQSALTERRAYREPLTHAEAHAIMLGMTHKLDADLLRAFLPIVQASAAPVG